MNPLDRAFLKAYAKDTATGLAEPSRSRGKTVVRGSVANPNSARPVDPAVTSEPTLVTAGEQTLRFDPPHAVAAAAPTAAAPATAPVAPNIAPSPPPAAGSILLTIHPPHAQIPPLGPIASAVKPPAKPAVHSVSLEQVPVGTMAREQATKAAATPAAPEVTIEAESEYRLQTVEAEAAAEVRATLAAAAELRLPAVLPLPPGGSLADRAAEAKPMLGIFAEPRFEPPAKTEKRQDQEKFTPDWEVDRFVWPTLCDQLLAHEKIYFDKVGRRLAESVAGQHQVLFIAGSRRGEGRTTLALCLARCAAAAGLRVALLDADLQNPQLGPRLGVETPCGWWEVVEETAPLREAAIASIEDGITLFPQTQAHDAANCSDDRAAAVLRRIGKQFPLVIIDGAPLATDSPLPFGSALIDAAIVLRDLRFASSKKTNDIAERLLGEGVAAVGIAENYRKE